MRSILFILTLLIISSCSEKPSAVSAGANLYIRAAMPTGAFALDSVYKNEAGEYFKVSDFKFYIAQLEAKNSNGEWQLVDDAYLVDFTNASNVIPVKLPANSVAIRFGIGVPKGINTGDPTLYPNSHPFSVAGANGMHWSWNIGYKFILFEGRYDSLANGSFVNPFAIHTGTDSLYTTAEFSIQQGGVAYDLTINAEQLLNGIRLSSSSQTHGFGNLELSQLFTINFEKSIKIHALVE